MKRRLIRLLSLFDLGDHEYIRFEAGRRPWFRFWLTVYGPRYRRPLHRKIFPWRIRFLAAHWLIKRLYSRCTRCGAAFTLRELVYSKDLNWFMSGSICHKDCEPSEEWKRRVAERTLRP
jgi:hypothetical protein